MPPILAGISPNSIIAAAKAMPGSVCFGCIAPNSHRDFQATYSASKRNPGRCIHCLVDLVNRTVVAPAVGCDVVGPGPVLLQL